MSHRPIRRRAPVAMRAPGRRCSPDPGGDKSAAGLASLGSGAGFESTLSSQRLPVYVRTSALEPRASGRSGHHPPPTLVRPALKRTRSLASSRNESTAMEKCCGGEVRHPLPYPRRQHCLSHLGTRRTNWGWTLAEPVRAFPRPGRVAHLLMRQMGGRNCARTFPSSARIPRRRSE